jgi:hypothetical protein
MFIRWLQLHLRVQERAYARVPRQFTPCMNAHVSSARVPLKAFARPNSRLEHICTHLVQRPGSLLRPGPGQVTRWRLRSLIQVQDHVGEELSGVHILQVRVKKYHARHE